MTKDGSSSAVPPAPKAGKRPLARVGCALRGGHAYVPSRKLDGYETCAYCGHRRMATDTAWFAESEGKAGQAEAGVESKLRPVAMMLCTVRRYHNFMPSRRMEGYDTCIECGYRRKAALGAWFASPASRPPPAIVEEDTTAAPELADGAVVIPFAEGEPATPGAGVDPRVLRDFLKQIDSGALNPAPRPGKPRSGGRRRGSQTPQT